MNCRARLLLATGISSLLPLSIIRQGDQADQPLTDSVHAHAYHHLAGSQDKPDPNSASACGECHTAIHDEWKADGQMHANAWDDKLYQEKLKKKKRPKTCYACHIPDRVLARVGRKPKTRKTMLHEGVTCVSCHESGGKMHGPYGAETDAHGTQKNELFTPKGSNALCNSCHKTKIDVVLPVGKDFDKSGLEAKGKSCIGCHMAEVERPIANEKGSDKPSGIKRKGRSHTILGPSDAEFCASAFKLTVSKVEGRAVLKIENMTGHRVPGLTTRNFVFVCNQLDADGKILATDKTVVSSETDLPVLETRDVPLTATEGATKLEIVIQHHFLGKLFAELPKTTLPL